MSASSEQVVITGLGAITPLGCSVDSFWANLLEGRTGYRTVRAFDIGGQRTSIGCEVADFEEDSPEAARAGGGRATSLAVAAAGQALRQSGIDTAASAEERIGVCLGTTMGEIRLLERHLEIEAQGGPVEAPSLGRYPCFTIPQAVAQFYRLSGPNLMIPTACAAGNYAIGIGRDLLLSGQADMMLVGGVDPYSRVAHTGFNRLLSMSPDVCRPFDARRRGIVLGEGAGMLLLETGSHARERGVRSLASVLGYGLSNDGHHITNPDPVGNGLARAISRALASSGVDPRGIDYISAHGTGTPANDAAETAAIKEAFGEQAYRVPVSSIKSMIGHTMGAASALEAVASVMSLLTGSIPPTMNYEHPDPRCDLDYVPNRCRRLPIRRILSNAMAFGGNNACLVLAQAGEG